MQETGDFHIESSLPKPWEQEQSFNDVLYEWINKAPWLAISGARANNRTPDVGLSSRCTR